MKNKRVYGKICAVDTPSYNNKYILDSLRSHIQTYDIVLVHHRLLPEGQYRIFKNRHTLSVFEDIGVHCLPEGDRFGIVTMTEGQIIALALSLS